MGSGNTILTREYKEIINYHYGQEHTDEQRKYASYRLFYPPVTIETSLEYGEKKRLIIPTRMEALFQE